MISVTVVLLILFLVMVIVGAVRGEFRGSAYWFQIMVGVAILVAGGVSGLLG